MSLSLITNIGSLTASNALTNNQMALQQSIAQLSSGKRIVSAQDDPAGLSISMETQGLLGSLGQAASNVSNAQSFLQTADGALANIGNLLQLRNSSRPKPLTDRSTTRSSPLSTVSIRAC